MSTKIEISLGVLEEALSWFDDNIDKRTNFQPMKSINRKWAWMGKNNPDKPRTAIIYIDDSRVDQEKIVEAVLRFSI